VKKSHFIAVSLVLLSLCTTLSPAAFADATPAASTPAAGVVNINTATAGELANLPRVGLKAAQRIVDYRTEHGPFHKATDLMQVKGFGDKSFNRLSAYVTVSGNTTLTAKVKSARKQRAKKQPATTASM
jgi:competence ComEA-like helix-hairpin-helix protein